MLNINDAYQFQLTFGVAIRDGLGASELWARTPGTALARFNPETSTAVIRFDTAHLPLGWTPEGMARHVEETLGLTTAVGMEEKEDGFENNRNVLEITFRWQEITPATLAKLTAQAEQNTQALKTALTAIGHPWAPDIHQDDIMSRDKPAIYVDHGSTIAPCHGMETPQMTFTRVINACWRRVSGNDMAELMPVLFSDNAEMEQSFSPWSFFPREIFADPVILARFASAIAEADFNPRIVTWMDFRGCDNLQLDNRLYRGVFENQDILAFPVDFTRTQTGALLLETLRETLEAHRIPLPVGSLALPEHQTLDQAREAFINDYLETYHNHEQAQDVAAFLKPIFASLLQASPQEQEGLISHLSMGNENLEKNLRHIAMTWDFAIMSFEHDHVPLFQRRVEDSGSVYYVLPKAIAIHAFQNAPEQLEALLGSCRDAVAGMAEAYHQEVTQEHVQKMRTAFGGGSNLPPSEFSGFGGQEKPGWNLN